MSEKPSFASDYKKENVELVRQTTLYVATKLGDLLDHLVVVGGLVPSLLIPDESLPIGEDAHIGTMDLDLGLSLQSQNQPFITDSRALHYFKNCGQGGF